MENKYLIGLGAIALGMFAYSRYAKKDDSGQGEDPNTGGGGGGIGGGGGFMPNFPTPPIPPTPPTPPTPPSRPTNQGRIINDASVFTKNTTPTRAITSSVEAQKIQNATNTGGITGIGTGAGTGTGTATTVGTGVGSYMTTKVGGNVLTPFKPFSGCEPNGRRPIFLDDLVRSWNRP